MVSRAIRAAILVATSLALACGGGGGGSPTQPPPATGNLVTVAIGVNSLDPGQGVREASVSLDGREVGRRSWPGGCAGGCLANGMVSNVPADAHTVSFTVLAQSRPSVRYFGLGTVVVRDTASGRERRFDLPRQNATLRVGQSISYPVSF